ncbi:NfeD family protein [Salinithrix halophila]|uniref:NfeD family protein n=1 Tax=Salinithrix halophila TaxID=1485204 RepID=A0ABV8JA38_9BACL
MEWTTIYWACFFIGLGLTGIIWLFGDLLDGVLDGLMELGAPLVTPLTLVGALTAFGASGIVLGQTTPLEGLLLTGSALFTALAVFFTLYLFFVKPMENAESSIGFRLSDLTGRKGEVITTIPATGCGEVLIWTGGGNTNQIASSFHGESIPQGSRIVVQKVEEHTLWVVPDEPNEE